jgi:hypothetical protein
VARAISPPPLSLPCVLPWLPEEPLVPWSAAVPPLVLDPLEPVWPAPEEPLDPVPEEPLAPDDEPWSLELPLVPDDPMLPVPELPLLDEPVLPVPLLVEEPDWPLWSGEVLVP